MSPRSVTSLLSGRSAVSKWQQQPLPQLLDLQSGKKCVVIGTFYKEMKLKPNILDEHNAREKYEAPPPERSKYNADDDSAVLEDHSGRAELLFDAEKEALVGSLTTGIVMALLGHETAGGQFLVEDICFQGLLPQAVARPIGTPGSREEEDTFVVIISGLNIGGTQQSMLPLQLFVDYVSGMLGGGDDTDSVCKIAKVIVAGNLIGATTNDELEQAQSYNAKNVEAATLKNTIELDEVLAQLSAVVSIDIMPGQNDPSNSILPQQPMHSCMFPRASQYATLSNPPPSPPPHTTHTTTTTTTTTKQFLERNPIHTHLLRGTTCI